jgi:hypothetical protein
MQVSGKKLLLVLASWLSFSSFCNSQEVLTTPNVVTNQWIGAVPASPGGTTGGNVAGYNSATNTLLFGYTSQTVHQRIILSNVLEGTGLKVHGYNYSFEYINSGLSRGTLNGVFYLDDIQKRAIDSHGFSLGPTEGWKSVDVSKTFRNQYALDYAHSISLNFTGKDDRYWAGYYGPQIRNVNLSVRYTQDQCAVNPLSSPTCEGYEKANFEQQCKISPFYNNLCPGYEQAFFNQQCLANPLYNSGCPGYTQALFTKTCNDNPLSDTRCPLYQQAYLDQQCKANPLFSSACPLYQKAFFDQQCTANPLYNSGCPGYAEAFKAKQIVDACSANPQSNPSCKGYVTPTFIQKVEHEVSVTIKEDPVKLLTSPRLVDDPIVNQAIQKDEVKQEAHFQGLSLSNSVRQITPTPSQRRTEQQMQKSDTRTGQAARGTTSQSAQKSQQESEQEAVLASMGNVPGFSRYTEAKIPDVQFYKVEDIYKKATIPDNARAQRQLNQRSDRLHKEMVDEQYRK